jgi:tetratricopeptide (TPR) repeat protein
LSKLVQAYLGLTGSGSDGERTGAFPDLVRSWETAHPAAAQDGYLAIVRRHHEVAPEKAEQALLRWIVLASEQRTLSAASVEEAYRGVPFAPVSELHELLLRFEREGPEHFETVADVERALSERRFGTDLRFWGDTEGRRHVVGLAALALGRASVVARFPEQAERQWVLGLAMAPPMEDYIIGGLSEEDFLPLELITELAWLQFRYPEFDPDGQKFNYFIKLLFVGKAQAYEGRDLRAIQRHHTVLGEIFAAKGIWKSDWADNAIFQLSHAIDIAEKRAAEEGFYQPLPGLRERLAEGYDRTGQEDKAAAMLIEAGRAYLDTDDLDRAAAMLDRARDFGETVEAAALNRVLSWRRSVEAALDNGGSGLLDLQQVVRDLRSLRLPADFVARQSFKLTADLGRLRSRSSTGTARDAAQSAILAARQANTLIGTGDVSRLEWSANSVWDAPRPLSVDITPAPAPRLQGQPDWQVSLPSSDRAFSATISNGEQK